MVGARSHRTFSESLGVATSTSEEEGRTDEVTDLRELNKQSIKDSYPLTNIQEILHSLQGATMFSSLDAHGAYHAVRIEPGSRACTAFISPFWHIPVYTYAIWISQCWECVQQDAGLSMK